MVDHFEEKRCGERVDFETKIELTTPDSALHLLGNSKDLALKGVFVRTEAAVEIGTPCDVRITTTGVREITLNMQGTVVRKTSDGLGIAFHSMDLDTYTHLRNIVRYNCRNPDDIL